MTSSKIGISPFVGPATSTNIHPSRVDSGLLDLLIGGGEPAADLSTIQQLALDLLYAPRFMENPTTVTVPAWSAAAVNPPLFQLPASANGIRYAPNIAMAATATFQNNMPRCPPMTAGEVQLIMASPQTWRTAAAAEIRNRKLDERRVSDRSIRYNDNVSFAAGLKYAPFWIRIGPDLAVPAYPLYWTGPNEGGLLFVVCLSPDRYVIRFLSASAKYRAVVVAYDNTVISIDDDDDWLPKMADRQQADALRYFGIQPASEPSIWYDRDLRSETVLSAALSALDSKTVRLAGLSVIRGGISTDPFPDELLFEIVAYLILPPIPAAMLNWLAAIEQA